MESMRPISHYRSTIKACGVLLVTSLFFFYEFGMSNIFDSLESSIAHDYHLSAAMVGWIASLYFYSNIAFLLPAGILLDRFSPRKIIMSAMFICAMGVLCVALSHSLALLVVSRLLMGVGGGFCFIGCVRIAVNWFDARDMARATGFIVTMGFLGGFIVQRPLNWLIELTNWRMALVVVAVVGFVITVLIALLVRDIPQGCEAQLHARKSHLHALGLFKSLKLALGKAQNWWCAIYAGSINIPIFMLGALWGIPYLTTVHGLSAGEAASIAGMMYIGTMIGSMLAGWVSDKLQRRRLPMLVGAILSLILAIIMIKLQSHSYAIWFSLFFLMGLITSTQVISYPTLGESNHTMITSTATSLISLWCLLGGAIVQPLFGALIARGWEGAVVNGAPVYSIASYQFAMKILLIGFVVSIIAALMVKETYCQRQEVGP